MQHLEHHHTAELPPPTPQPHVATKAHVAPKAQSSYNPQVPHQAQSARDDSGQRLTYQSYWHLTGPAIATDTFEEPQERDAHERDMHKRDVIVVGAGITGLCTAVLLARAGKTVTILEARTVGSVTTGNTTGKVSLLQGQVFSDIQAHAGDEAVQAYLEANQLGQSWLLHELEQAGGRVERRPAFTYATHSDAVAALEQELAAYEVAGLPVKWAETPELPFPTAGALRLEDQAQVHALEMLSILATELRSRGGKIVEQCRVTDAYVDQGSVVVETTLGMARAQHVVFATGTPILDRSLFFARLEPSRSIAASYRVPGPIPQGMYLSVDEPSRSLRTAGQGENQVLIVGGDSHITGRNDDTSADFVALDEWVQQHFAGAKMISSWAAQDYRTHSRVSFAGPIHGSEGLVYAATGYNKWGMTNGVAAALTMSSEILGTLLPWAQTLRERTASLKQATSTNMSVLSNMASGWAKLELTPPADPTLLQENEGAVIREGLTPVATARIDGVTCRVSGICTHMGAVLNWNTAERTWDCPLHGSRFTPEGEVLEGPAVQRLERYENG